MKKGLFLLLSMTLSYLSMAQVPNSFSYQMVIRNGNNELVANTTVGIRIGLLGGNAADTVWYEEEHKVKTNLNGLAYITIGKGNILKGAVSTIDWTKGPFFIKSETDPTGGTNYSLIIVSQMLSVPYAIYAKTAEKLSTPVMESDPLFSKSLAKGITSEDTARWSRKEVYDGNSGGGGITNESDPVFSTSVAKGIRSVDTAAWNNKLNLRDTMNILRPYLRASDTASLSNRLNQKVDINQLNTNTLTLDGKINIADTAGMLANYRTGINAKVNIADTASMLNPYLRKIDTVSVSNRINLKVNIADTAGMLTPYLRKIDTASVSNRINLKVNIADTAGMLNPYLRKIDTVSVSNRINLKVNIADTAGMLTPYLRKLDTASVSNRINLKVNIADTADMLMPYLRKLDTASVSDRINTKVNIADTAGMLTPYLRKLDTASVSDRINLKVNIADTAGMLTPYLRKLDTASVSDRINLKVNIADTSNMLANYRSALNVKAPINNPTFTGTVSGVDKNMVGLGSVDNTSDANKPVSTATQTALNGKENTISSGTTGQYYRGDKTFQTLDKSVVGLGNVDNTSDANKPVSTATQTALNLKVNIADTASMLTPYLRKLDTASLSNRINNAGLPTTGNATGNIMYWNGSAWVRLPAGSNGQILQINGGIPAWANPDFICGVSKLLDIDNNKYNTVKIVSQCWMSENLRVTKYNDGTDIPLDESGGATGNEPGVTWVSRTTGARTVNGHSATNLATYGYLYNWYAAKGIASAGSTSYKNICPEGWRVPTDGDWNVLVSFLNGSSQAGGKMKSTVTQPLTGGWDTPNTAATNESGFSVLPSGYREYDNTFDGIKRSSGIWSSTPYDPSNSLYRYMNYNLGDLGRTFSINQVGLSIRCLKE